MSEDKVKIRVTTKNFVFTAYVDKQYANQLHELDKIAVDGEFGRSNLEILKLEVLDNELQPN